MGRWIFKVHVDRCPPNMNPCKIILGDFQRSRPKWHEMFMRELFDFRFLKLFIKCRVSLWSISVRCYTVLHSITEINLNAILVFICPHILDKCYLGRPETENMVIIFSVCIRKYYFSYIRQSDVYGNPIGKEKWHTDSFLLIYLRLTK